MSEVLSVVDEEALRCKQCNCVVESVDENGWCPSCFETGVICSQCNGSGEGMYDGSTCRICGGSGNSMHPRGCRTRFSSRDDPERERDLD